MQNNINTDTPITSFTLNELIALSGEQRYREGVLKGCIAANSSSQMHLFRFPCRIDAFIIGVGTEGESKVSFNLHEYCLHKDSLFVIGPKNIIETPQTEEPDNFKCHVLIIAPEFLQNLNVDTKHMMPLFLKIATHPCLELSPDERRTLRNFIALIEQETLGEKTEFATDIVSSLISATIYLVGDILGNYLSEHPEVESPVHNRAEAYFKQFTQLLGEHYRRERSVGFYARQLCITPKYLTTLIKHISGKSVSDWIDSYVTLEAKTLLKYSNMSVQEIAYYLNFPNQSFFGSYFKRNTGMSPSQYKAKQ